ncbi:hypothetical protein JKI95_08580 [Corynebacterium aquatimens]|uniref:hypothetical protein n=1 Tax=Corynebacterium TaxID=1716 RepID=UPI001F2E196F|nr:MULTISPECIES: hypothetical protein [Corynebacterium]QYH19246.1 hypothetical protein JKI95_08580 [Corynebacterium aquatimens]UIZ91867.1 hypothetical protein JZY91_09270 [Corynebacterium sp. CNCTC7651]
MANQDANGQAQLLQERMTLAFPWMHALPPEDRQVCAQDLLNAARASFSTGQSHLALTNLTAWRETATAIAAGLDRTELEWLEDGETVERP